MKEITLEDCYELEVEFRKYCETAEQHEFITLLMIEVKLGQSIDKFVKESKSGIVTDQETANIMFRVVKKVMGKDFSEYI